MSDYIDEEYEKQSNPKSALFKYIFMILVPIFATEMPLYLGLFEVVTMETAMMLMMAASSLSITPMVLMWHFQTSSVTGKSFFKPLLYWTHPGKILPEDQAEIAGKIVPLREKNLVQYEFPIDENVDYTICKQETPCERMSPDECSICEHLDSEVKVLKDKIELVAKEQKVNINNFILKAMLKGTPFDEIAALLSAGFKAEEKEKILTANDIKTWWQKLGGFYTANERASIKDYPYRYLIEFVNLPFDATILCSRVPYEEIGTSQEQDDVLYKGYFVKARCLPISLHEIEAFTYAGYRLTVTVVLACDKSQSEIMEGAGSFNMPNPTRSLVTSAKKDFDLNIGIKLAGELADANAHIDLIGEREETFEERVFSAAERRFEMLRRTAKEKKSGSRFGKKSKLGLILVVGAIILVYLWVFGVI